MISSRHRAQLGLGAAATVFAVSVTIILAGALQRPDLRTGQPGSLAASFRLPDLKGHIVALSAMRGRVVLLCFAAAPNSDLCKQDAQRMTELARRYDNSAEVKLVTVYSATDDLGPAEIRQIRVLATDAGPSCTTLLDPTSSVLSRYRIQETPTFLIIDAKGMIRYRGQIDDTSDDAPLAATSFPRMIDLLLAERPLPAEPAPAVLSKIK